MEEKIIYEHRDIKVSNVRAVFGDKTFSMSNITSVMFIKIPKVIRLYGVTIIFFAITIYYVSKDSSATWQIPTAIFLALIGALLIIFDRQKYAVRIGTAGGEINAIILKSESEIKSIVDSLNEAIIKRG